MDASAISADVTRDALRAIRYGHRDVAGGLLGLRALADRLRAAGLRDTPANRAWELGRWLDALTAAAVRDARRAVAAAAGDENAAAEDDLARLQHDFRAGNADLEAWSTLRYRYFAAHPQRLEDVAVRLGVVYRTVARRLNRGHDLLANRLREAELAAIDAAGDDAAGSDAAPLPTVARPPTATTTLVGRDGDIAAVRERVARHRLVTIIGTGGIGKTRVAVAVAADPPADVGEAVWVALDRLAADAEVAVAVAAALGLADPPVATDVESALVGALAAHRGLIVLDNCEHVIASVRRLAEHLLRACPAVRLLATSRESLHIPGEALWPLPLLAVPDPARDIGSGAVPVRSEAVDLFEQRAADVVPGFRITPANAAVVGDICRHLDGLPLAIELAVAALRTMPVEALAELLAERHRLPGRRHAGLGRHGTLHATIDWSWDRLDDGERRLFRRLSVFAGGFTLRAAERIAAEGDGAGPEGIDTYDVLDLLTALVEQSLVEPVCGPDGAARYRLLHTLRTYAHDRLRDAGEADDVARRHAVYFASWAADHGLEGPEGSVWRARFDDERDNLQAALSWSLAADPGLAARLAAPLGTYWLMRGALRVGRSALERVIERLGDADVAVPPTVLEVAGRIARQQGDFASARSYLDEALAHRGQLENTVGMASILRERGNVAEELGDAPGAERFYAQSLAQYEANGDAWGQAAVRNNLGILAQHRGDPAGALSLLEASLAAFRDLDVPFAVGIALSNVAGVQADLGRFDRASALFEESVAIARRLGDPLGIASGQIALGYLQFRQERETAAQAALLEAHVLLLELGDLQKRAEWLATAALLVHAAGDDGLAAELLGAEDGLRAAIGSPVAPKEATERADLVRDLVAALGPTGFDAARGDGERRGWAAAADRAVAAWARDD